MRAVTVTRWVGLVGVAAVVAGVAVQASGDAASSDAAIAANVSMSVTTPTRAVASGGREAIAYTVILRNHGGAELTVQVEVDDPGFVSHRAGQAVREGSPAQRERIELAGPASDIADRTMIGDLAGSTCAEPHGFGIGSETRTLVLPAGSTSILTVTYRMLGQRLWRGMDVRPTFVLGAVRGASPKARARATASLRGPQIAITGKPSADITLSTSPRISVTAALKHLRSVSSQTGVHIFGRVNPPTAGRLVRLMIAGPHDRVAHTLATVRTDAHGRFAYARWHPPSHGRWSLGATASGDAAAAADYVCPLGLIAR